MQVAWRDYLARFAPTLCRPSKQWTTAESDDVWAGLAKGPVADSLFRFVRAKVRDYDVAEELLAVCLMDLAIHQTYDPGNEGPSKFRAWLYACIRNHIAAYFTRRGKELARNVDLDESVQQTTSYGAPQSVETRLELESVLAVLSARERSVLMFDLRGYSDLEIANSIQTSTTNVRQIRFRAMKKLRGKWGGAGTEFSRFQV
jgi:RNA polymerase sigma factor (sigma-70 family)